MAFGLQLDVRIPFDEPTFRRQSVDFAGETWRRRYDAVTHHPNVRLLVMPDELGPTPSGTIPYQRLNRWQLDVALAFGPERLRFLCLWDGHAGDGPGGTEDMVDSVRAEGGRVRVLDSTALFFGGVTP